MRQEAPVAQREEAIDHRCGQRIEEVRDENREQEADDFAHDARIILERPKNELVAPLAQRMALFKELPPILQMRGEEIHDAVHCLADVTRQVADALRKFLWMAETEQLLFHALHELFRYREVLEVDLERKNLEKRERWRENEQH